MKMNDSKLRLLIYKHGTTQTALAQQAGVSRSTVAQICNGKRCHEATAQKIADALGVSLDTIKARG